MERLHLNRSKQLAKYFAKPQYPLIDISPLDTGLGVLSFSLYLLRFCINCARLIELLVEGKKSEKQDKELYLSLFNDALWSTVNSLQFFYLTFSRSDAAGFRGMQLEALAQCVDLIILIYRFVQDKEEYEHKLQQASAAEKNVLEIEWQAKQIHFVRSIISSVSILIAFSVFSFSLSTFPLSLVISIIVLMNSLSRLLIDVNRDQQLEHNEVQTHDRLTDLNQILLYNVLLPAGLFLFIAVSIQFSVLVCLAMALTYYGTQYFIDTVFTTEPELPGLQILPK